MENNESSLKFTVAENKIRKKWLFLSVILPAIANGLIIIISLFAAFSFSNFKLISAISILSLIMAAGIYINYYCAYKNPGTILLLLIMILTPLSLIKPFFKQENLELMKKSQIFSLLMLIILVFEIAVFYYSYKLRIINKKMKEHRLISSPAYLKALSIFSTATNLEELNKQFTLLRTSNELNCSEGVLVKAFNQQKKMLTI